jgi:hypothetical protein
VFLSLPGRESFFFTSKQSTSNYNAFMLRTFYIETFLPRISSLLRDQEVPTYLVLFSLIGEKPLLGLALLL